MNHGGGNNGNEYRLLRESSLRGSSDQSAAETPRAGLEVLTVPDGVSRLNEIALGGTAIGPAGLVIEVLPALPALPGNRQTRLLLLDLARSGSSLRLNGGPAPRMVMLEVGDHLALVGGCTLHVSRWVTAPLRPAGEDVVGRLCPICQSRIQLERRIYACPCGTVLHAEEPQMAGSHASEASDTLECFRLATRGCPDCGAEVVFEEGFLYVPEGLEVEP